MNLFKKLFNKAKEVEEKVEVRSETDPYIDVVKIIMPNPKDPTIGYFELDWNSAFVAQLRESGYSGRTEEEVVDQWFNDLCRGVAADKDM